MKLKQMIFFENFYEISDHPENSKFLEPVNKNIIGKMKDEIKGNIISEFVGLKSKIYSLAFVTHEEIEKGKDVNKSVIKNIRHKEYVDVLLNKYFISHKMKRIQSKLHKIGTYDSCKISLSCFDNKRYILGDGTNSLAYFHEDVKIQ